METPEPTNENSKGPKQFRQYFFDFFMLFLAVFCGFLADNLRESLIESDMEQEYIASLVEDLKSDTAKLDQLTAETSKSIVVIDSLLDELSSERMFQNSRKAQKLWAKSVGFVDFVYNDRTIQQLKNTGALRLVKNRAVSDSIMKYDQAVKALMIHQQVLNNTLIDQSFYLNSFNFIALEKDPDAIVPLTNFGAEHISAAYANRKFWKGGLRYLRSQFTSVNQNAKRLIAFISKEYDLE
jgi:hypothetical protein